MKSFASISRREFLKNLGILAQSSLIAPFLPKASKNITLPVIEASCAPVSPSRVVRVHNSESTFWDYSTGVYVDYIREPVVRDMMGLAVQRLAGTSSVNLGWKTLFPYRPGDTVAIKGNFSEFGSAGYSKQVYPTPQVIRTIVDGLTAHVGIPPSDIYLFELSFGLPSQGTVDRPVNFVTRGGTGTLGGADLSATVSLRSNPGMTIYVPGILTQAAHVIDLVGMRTGGMYGSVSTDCFKNHFGTVRHDSINNTAPYLHNNKAGNIVDIRRNTHLRDKTRLIVCDLLFAATDRYMAPEPWGSFPGGPTPNSILVSKDPVAFSSVQRDYMDRERASRGLSISGDDYLREAAGFNLGIYERGVFGSDFTYSNIDYAVVDMG